MGAEPQEGPTVARPEAAPRVVGAPLKRVGSPGVPVLPVAQTAPVRPTGRVEAQLRVLPAPRLVAARKPVRHAAAVGVAKAAANAPPALAVRGRVGRVSVQDDLPPVRLEERGATPVRRQTWPL